MENNKGVKYPACTFKVANIGLERSDVNGIPGLSGFVLTEDCSKRGSLGRISCHCPRTVALYVFCITNVKACSAVDRPNEDFLRVTIWHSDSRCSTILVDASITNDCSNAISSKQSLFERLEYNTASALSLSESASPFIKCKAFTFW